MRLGITIGASFGCPFEGEVPLRRLLQIVEACARHEPQEIALADTIGVAHAPRHYRADRGGTPAAAWHEAAPAPPQHP